MAAVGAGDTGGVLCSGDFFTPGETVLWRKDPRVFTGDLRPVMLGMDIWDSPWKNNMDQCEINEIHGVKGSQFFS